MATQPPPFPQTAPAQPQAAPPRTATSSGTTEDARFLAFAKENIGLLAGVASVPLLSSAAGALKPPDGLDQLTVLSSLLCIIVFAACFTMRGLLGLAPKSRHKWAKAIPGGASLALVGLAIYLIASFVSLEKRPAAAASKGAGGPAAATGAAAAGGPSGAKGPGGTMASSGLTGAGGAAGAGSTAGPGSTAGAGSTAATGGAPTAGDASGKGGTMGTGGTAGSTAGASGTTGVGSTAGSGGAASTSATAGTGSTGGPGGAAGAGGTAGAGGAIDAGTPDTLRTRVILFLSIYPTLMLALGLILVTNFTQQTAHDIQTIIEQKLPEQAKSLFDRLQLIGRFYDIGRMPGQKEFLAIGEELISERNEILQKLSDGIIELGGAEALRMQQTLVKTFNKSFDAVSCRDLDFWVNTNTDGMSREYFRLNLEALKRSDQVTRLLIFSDAELARTTSVAAAIQLHERYGIGWAVVPYMDLDPSTREEDDDVANDFALYDDSKVAIYFRDYDNGTRKLRAVFPGPDRRDLIDRQRKRHAELVAQCWLVSNAFLKRLENRPVEELAALKKNALKNALITARLLELTEHANRLSALDPATAELKDCFLFPTTEADIDARAREMYELRRKCADWAGPRAPLTPDSTGIAVAAAAAAAGAGGAPDFVG